MVRKYDEILTEIKNEHALCVKNLQRFVGSAKTKIPALADALRNESTDGIKLSNDDVRDRIMKDCLQFWNKRAILYALPDWLKRAYDTEEIQSGDQVLDIVLPEEDEKYKYEQIKECTLEIKRAFGLLLKNVTSKEEITELYNDWSYMEHTVKNVKTRIEQTGRYHKAILKNPLDDKEKQLRKPISVYDLNFTNNDYDMQKYIEIFTDDMHLLIKQLIDIVNGVNRYQIYELDDIKQMVYSLRSLLILAFNGANNKSSQSIYQQLETEHLAQETTDKHAGRESKTKTVVCAKCIKKFDAEHNDDPPIMQIDNKSPNGLRCPKCLEIEVCERGLTQDIVTQRKEFLARVSEYLGNYSPLDFIEVYAKKVKEPITGTKKVLMSNMLKNSSSFGSTIEEMR